MRIFYIVCLILLLFPSLVLSAPTISTATVNTDTLVISGSTFGVKTHAAPLFYNDMESDTIGALPTGMSNTGTSGTVETGTALGSKAINFSFSSSTEEFHRNFIDLGVGGVDNLYISSWQYFDKTGTTATQWQIKTIVFGSDVVKQGYFSSTANQTSGGLQNWWEEASGGRWYNVFGTLYYNGLTGGAGLGNLASDGYLWNAWQRIEIYAQGSSAPSTSDGKLEVNRIGYGLLGTNTSTAITHDADDDRWRIVGFGQGVASIAGGTLNLDVMYDNIYIDDTQARVELCDNSLWANKTVCFLQPPTAWSDVSITATLNQGSFTEGQIAYLFVIDKNGVVSAGKAITIGSSQLLTPLRTGTQITRTGTTSIRTQ